MKKLIGNKKKIVIVIIITLIILTSLVIRKHYLLTDKISNEVSEPDKNIITVQTKKILPEIFTEDISTSAVTEAFSEVIIFPETNGKVFAFYCSEGEYVKKGQLLAKLEIDQSLLANFENAKTNLEIAKESQENTEKLQKQLKKDAKGTPLEKSTKKTASLAIDTAEGQTKVARGQIDYIQAQLDKYSIKSSSDGFISRIDLENGDLATVTAPIITISNNQKIKIEVAVTEFDIFKIISGQEARIKLDSYPNNEFVGEVYYVSSIANPVSKKFPVKIQLENTAEEIKAGIVANVRIITNKQENSLVVPASAVFEENESEKIYIVKNSIVNIKTIKTEPAGEDKLLIKEGLLSGDEVIINGNYELTKGDYVNIKNK